MLKEIVSDCKPADVYNEIFYDNFGNKKRPYVSTAKSLYPYTREGHMLKDIGMLSMKIIR